MKKLCLFYLGILLISPVFAQDKPSASIPFLLKRLADTRKDTAQMDLRLEIAHAYILKPGEEHSDLDTALLLIRQVKQANASLADTRIEGLCLLFLAKAEREKGNPAAAKTAAFTALEHFRRNKGAFPLELAFCEVEAASYLNIDETTQLTQRIALYRDAVPIFENAGRTEMQASTLKILGDCLSYDNRSLEALGVLFESLKLYRSAHDTNLADLYRLIADCYREMGDHNNSIRYALLSLHLADSITRPSERYWILSEVGRNYFDLEQQVSAENYFRQALEAAKQGNDTVAIRYATQNWINSLIKQGKTDSALDYLARLTRDYPTSDFYHHLHILNSYSAIYIHIRRFDKASPIIRELVHIDSSLGKDDDTHLLVLFTVIDYYIDLKDFDKAWAYANLYRDYCNRSRDWLDLYKAEHWLFMADSARGRWKESVPEFQRYIKLRDSVFNARKGAQIAAMQLEFETEKKDRDIQILTQRQEISQVALHQASMGRNTLIGAAFLLIILLGLAVNRYRLKQRSNLLLSALVTEKDQLLDTKEWLIREVHHRVKNNLQLAMSLLNTQSFYIDNEKALAAIQQSKNRMYAMSLIHQRLYQKDNPNMIDLSDYVPELVDYIREGMEGEKHLVFDVIVDPVKLDVAQAIPLGLILNEAVTNAIKHAFPGRQDGVICIRIAHRACNTINVLISDNGIGEGGKTGGSVGAKAGGSMGRRLIDTLVRQLEGKMTIKSENGFSLFIDFPIEECRERVAI